MTPQLPNLAFGGGGGGTSAPLNSWYLDSNFAGVSLGATALIVWDHPFDDFNGTDMSVSSDGKTFTVNTTGIYGLTLYTEYVPSSTAAGFAFTQVNTSSSGAWGLFGSNQSRDLIQPSSTAANTPQRIYSLTPNLLTAADTITVSAGATLTAGTVTLQMALILFTRIG